MVLPIRKKIIPVQVSAPEPSPPNVGLKGERKKGIRRREPPPAVKHEVVEIFGELGAVAEQIKGHFGPRVIIRASSPELDYGRLSSGILAVDVCLAGGLRLSRGAMIYGNRSGGKSTLAGRFIAAAQRAFPDETAVLIDIEGTLDKPWFKFQGVDLDRLLVVEPESGEMAVDIADAVTRALETSIVVSDSIAMLVPTAEINMSAEDTIPAMQSRLVGNYLRRLNASLITERHRGHYPIVLHLNQFRMSLNVKFGDPRVLPGGKALEFSTSQQIEISNKEHTNVEKDKDGKKIAGDGDKDKSVKVLFNEHTIKITKDKTGGRYKEGAFKLIRDEAAGLPVGYIDQSKSIINHGLAVKLLDGVPGAFSFRNKDHGFSGKFRGQPEFLTYLLDDVERERQIVAAIVNEYRALWGCT